MLLYAFGEKNNRYFVIKVRVFVVEDEYNCIDPVKKIEWQMQPHFQLALVQLVVLHFLCQQIPGLAVLMVGLIRHI